MGSFKARRRQSKYKQILKDELNIDVTEKPSKNLMIGNAGLVTGSQYEQLAKLFTQFGSVQKIIMVPNKSYSFVVYCTVEDAVEAYSIINGRMKLANMDRPIYLCYTASVPTGFDRPTSNPFPEGLTLINDFVSYEEEQQLLECVNWDKSNGDTEKILKHRRVKHFGYEFRYDNNNVNKELPLSESIPEACSFIEGRLAECGHALTWSPNQLTVNQYHKGQGIPSHIDTHSAFESPILSLSLGSDVVMEFRRGDRNVPILLPCRSLLIMDGEARYAWKHGITPRTMDVVSVEGGLSVRERGCRTSFTFRRVREGSCNCQYSAHCDSQVTTIPEHQASRLEELYVHQVYNNIASHFSETRTKVWPNVEMFLQSFTAASILVDAGCGNGKYFGLNSNIFQVGFDRSFGLAEITRGRGHEVFVSDCLWLPIRDGMADGVISVAVLHHLSTRERRLQAIHEVSRVLAPGGRALITVWAKDQTKKNMTAYMKQDRKNRRNNYVQKVEGNTCFEKLPNENKVLKVHKINKTDQRKLDQSISFPSTIIVDDSEHSCLDVQLPVHTARTEFEYQDVFVPWKVKSKDPSDNEKAVFLRYYHVFEENELLQLCSSLRDIKILTSYYTEGNWCIIFEKVVIV